MIEITKGDAKTFKLRASRGNGQYMDLTGATIVTKLPAECGEVKTISAGQHTLSDQTVPATKGEFSVRIQSVDSATLKESFGDELLEVVSTVTQATDVTTVRGKILRVFPANPVS